MTMDITHYLNDNIINNKIKKNNVISTDLMNYLNKFYEEKKINLLEFTFLIEFIKSKGLIINVNWFVDIINRINNDDFINICYKSFDKLFTISQKKIKFDAEKLTNEFIVSKKDSLEFTNDQKVAIKNIINFISDRNSRVFSLLGYAGTGKTTTIVELLSYLIMNNYIQSIAFTAPTNKAVNVMKSKMRTNIKILAETLTRRKYNNDFNLDNIIDDINNLGIRIEFITIHRLLNYKNDFDIEGDRIFIRNGRSSINNYEIVIIDESSMISIQIITHLFEDVRNQNINIGDNYKKVPKLIFLGDPCQLFPVSESISAIFIKSKDQLSYDFFSKRMLAAEKNIKAKYVQKIQAIGSVERYNNLTSDIINMESIVLKEVVRNKIDNVVNLCYSIREWIENNTKIPNLNKFVGKGVYIYKYNRKNKKTETEWFKKFIIMQKNNTNNNTSNIILTWTNKQTDEYNTAIRSIMFKDKNNIDKFEIGDMLLLNDFYNFDETLVRGKDMKNRFYTSEQIKVMDKSIEEREYGQFIEQISKIMLKMKNSDLIVSKYKHLIKILNSKTKRKYTVWKLSVQRMSEALIKDIIPELYTIYVVHDNSNYVLESDKEVSLNLIKKFRKLVTSQYKDQATRIDREFIRPLWKQWNKIFIDPFAKVSYGNSHSVHKSQGSSFYNVFVDSDDILNNHNTAEAMRCIYTALTRSSNEIHLLV